MTMDNKVSAVFYDGTQLQISGDLGIWKSVKTFSFHHVKGANLQIVGYDSGSDDGCSGGGLLLECDNGWTSNTNDWVVFGTDSPKETPKLTDYLAPCQSSAGFSLTGQKSNAQKIWASNGKKYAWFLKVPKHGCNQWP